MFWLYDLLNQVIFSVIYLILFQSLEEIAPIDMMTASFYAIKDIRSTSVNAMMFISIH